MPHVPAHDLSVVGWIAFTVIWLGTVALICTAALAITRLVIRHLEWTPYSKERTPRRRPVTSMVVSGRGAVGGSTLRGGNGGNGGNGGHDGHTHFGGSGDGRDARRFADVVRADALQAVGS